jgi:hypothetical protein
MHPPRALFLMLAGLASLFVVSSTTRAQDFHAKTSEMAPEIKKYGNYATDFQAAEQNEHGDEFESTDFLQGVSTLAEERMLALDYTLAMYKSLSSPDRRAEAAKILKEQLDYYSWQFNNESVRIAGMIKFVKVPATIQLGMKLKEDMRTTKDKLDKLAASLDSLR